jgi:tetratricopeptide (TPR) repeat protein
MSRRAHAEDRPDGDVAAPTPPAGSAASAAGDRDRAARDLDEASRAVASLAPDDEVHDDAQFQLACMSDRRGELASRGASRLAESEGHYEEASRILARLIKDHGQVPHYRGEKVAALCGRAGVRFALSRLVDAQRDCEEALDHLAWLIGDQVRKGAPENPQYLSLLGRVQARQGRIHQLQGRPEECRKAREEAVENPSKAVRLDPARAADRAWLERIKADPSRWDESMAQDVMIRLDVPVPHGRMGWDPTWDATGKWPCTRISNPRVGRPADRRCLGSRDSRTGRYFRLVVVRGIMGLPLGVRPDGARTIPDLRGAFGWLRARPWMAAAGVLPHSGAPRRIPNLRDE